MHLNQRDPRPIYTQLVERFRQQILAGVLAEGDQLPSVRDLAAQLAVNPNTIQRAYRELEAQGWVSSIPGKGSFVRDCGSAGLLRQKELLEQLKATVRELESLGLTREAICDHISKGE